VRGHPDIRLLLADVDGTLVTQDKVLTEAAKEAARELYDAGIALAITSGGSHVARETWTVKFDAKVETSFTDVHLAQAVKIVGISDDLDLVAACEKVVQNTLGEKASAARSQPYYLDVTHPQANKGTVVTTLSKLLNIPPAQIATIGDMPNDVLMFRKGGFSIAMGNSSNEVKAQASAVTDSNENEGFAKAVREFVLPPNAP
jgi:hydroxymethylpyrimidine pyrophosphatase-like HAD family hydrolase